MRKVCAVMVSKQLMNEQDNHMAVSRDNLDIFERDPEFFRHHEIKGDEIWAQEQNVKVRHTENYPCPKKGIVHKQLVPQGYTVNQTFDRKVLLSFRKRMGHVQPAIGPIWMLHHDNASNPTEISINEFLVENKTFLWFSSLLIRLISVPVTSFYSLGSNPT
ncbi:hypothetical protein PR048_021542 [Dryococelus australis]|uniref:Uncharacterized protein n=1 Tax=Dryococelus australis TaxID=614101 RepID=A0ABQ9GYJ6_9NEOP|nr:hypothetical protein PR048_021542 [Dryococelus australis]